jgi:two-component system, sensor histidine kinase YesM
MIVLVVFTAFFYLWVSNLLKTKAFESTDNLSTSLCEKLEYEIQKMDTVSMNILYSNLVKDRFAKYSAYTGINSNETTDQKSKLDAINNSKELIDVLTAINGPSRPVQQIYLYNFKGEVFGTGFDNRQLKVSVKDKSWYQDTLKSDGHKIISQPEQDPELSKLISAQKDINYISLCRLYFDRNNVPQGIVEVKQYYDIIFNNISEFIKKETSSEKIYVYDNSGKLVYPIIDTPENSSYYFSYYKQSQLKSFHHTGINPVTKEKELLVYKRSDYTGWIITTAISEKKLFSPVFEFTKTVIVVAIVILFLALMFSFFASKKYTTPISTLYKMIRSTNWQGPNSDVPMELSSGLHELEELNNEFHKMNLKIKASVEELLLSQQHEMQSKMLALQSQMNPHFLYNTLATISVMAEENMDEEIVEMCGYVSDMLRYISSDKEPLVKINTELEYTEKYLSCMKLRHGSKLNYSMEIDKQMVEIHIPKLLIQPLVENALKYSTKIDPPWNIRVLGFVNNNYWQIQVQDNGPGFSTEKLDHFNQKIQEIEHSGLLPSLELEGMGLLNIYMRLKLLYKTQMIFQISNYPSGGAIVTIGGSTGKYSRSVSDGK